MHGNTVRVDCPQFDRGGPRAWKLKCETYLRVYGLHPKFGSVLHLCSFRGVLCFGYNPQMPMCYARSGENLLRLCALNLVGRSCRS